MGVLDRAVLSGDPPLILAALVAVSIAASDLPSCSEIQARAKGYSLAQVMAFARKHKLTAERRQHVRECLRDKK